MVSSENVNRRSVIERMGQVAGAAPSVVEGSVLDRALLDRVFAKGAFDGIIHFAARKAVGESVARPLDYFETNIGGLTTLAQAARPITAKLSSRSTRISSAAVRHRRRSRCHGRPDRRQPAAVA